MQNNQEKAVRDALERYANDRGRLLDIAHHIQAENGCISRKAIELIAEGIGISSADVEQTISFYHFFSSEPRGKYTIYLNNSVVANMKGRELVAREFEKQVGCKFGEVSEDGLIGLFDTPCIGMSDQEPSALINGKVFTKLTTYNAREIIREIRAGKTPDQMSHTTWGDGNNASPLMRSVVRNHIRRIGPMLDRNYEPGHVLVHQLAQMTPQDVLREVKLSELRGRGGAGFPTGLKWEFCRRAEGERKYIFCNADEGEPGTFKDRVLLTERPGMLVEGMVIAAHAVGAQEGVIYLRYEYRYMEDFLENVLEGFRNRNQLGKNICGLEGFDFDIRIQFGAGSYVCGEESALIESAEGKRGEPRPRPPFPVEKGYMDCPTIVNNVETLCATVSIISRGGEWYSELGIDRCRGTKLLSVSGDCRHSGIYEVEWGCTVSDILEMAGAVNTQAVQMGGPSGSLISAEEFNRQICYTDLATGGSLMIFDQSRDLLRDVVLNFMEFFIKESCGSCVPCRNIPTLLRGKLLKVLDGNGTRKDLEDMREWSSYMQINRCGLGHTAANPITSILDNFYAKLDDLIVSYNEFESELDLDAAIAESCAFVKREPTLKNNH